MSELAGKTVFVTGATGFLGGALVRRLAADGAWVRALARSSKKAKPLQALQNVEIVYGDITDIHQMRAAIAGSAIVLHVAASTRGTLDFQLEANLGGTRNVALAAAEHGVQRLVHVSTIATYGYDVRGVVTEATPQEPGNVPYNISKLEAETVLRQITAEYELSYSLIRPGMIYGASSGFWSRNMLQLAQLQPTPFIGDGSGTTYLIHVDDVVDLMTVQAVHPAAEGQAFNCVMDPAPTWREYLGALQALTGHQRWLPVPIPLMTALAPVLDSVLWLSGEPQDLRKLIPFVLSDVTYSMEKANNLLGWQPQVSLHEGIQRTLPYYDELGLL